MGSEMKDAGGVREVHREGAGKKEADKGRGHYELVSPLFMRRLAVWLEKGAEKYEARNWEKGIPMGRIMRALLRHTYQYLEGMRDEDHLAAISCNIMFLIHFEVGIERGLYSEEDAKAMQDLPDYTKKILKQTLKQLVEMCHADDCTNDQCAGDRYCQDHGGYDHCTTDGCANPQCWEGKCPTHFKAAE